MEDEEILVLFCLRILNELKSKGFLCNFFCRNFAFYYCKILLIFDWLQVPRRSQLQHSRPWQRRGRAYQLRTRVALRLVVHRVLPRPPDRGTWGAGAENEGWRACAQRAVERRGPGRRGRGGLAPVRGDGALLIEGCGFLLSHLDKTFG